MGQSKPLPLPGENELTPAQARLITCLLTGCNVRTAARDAGIVEKSAFRYLAMPHVQKALADGTNEIMRSAIERLQLLALEGLETIVEIMKDRDNQAHVRLKAAHILASRLTELKPVEAEQKDQGNIDYSVLTPEELDIVYPILAKLEERQKKQA